MRVERIPVTACDEGDYLCLVTDGVTKACTPGHVQECLRTAPNVEIGARRLTETALNLRSKDDITALVVEVTDWVTAD
jgi:serine/threonine protein phosphatase PrpC